MEVLAEVAAEESTSGASAKKRSGRIVEGVEGTECRRGGSIFDCVVVVEDELTLLAKYSFSFADASGSEEEKELLVAAGGRWRRTNLEGG